VNGARHQEKRQGETVMKIGFVRSVMAPALLLAALSGCEGLLADGREGQREQFTAATGRWDAANLASYSYTLQLSCECGIVSLQNTIVVTVQNGTVVSRVYQNTNPPTPAPESPFGAYDTVEELFAAVEDAIGTEADLLNVVYHPTYGVPVLLQLDPSSSDPDDHLAFQVSGFTVPTAP
jgi:hypothetical protein